MKPFRSADKAPRRRLSAAADAGARAAALDDKNFKHEDEAPARRWPNGCSVRSRRARSPPDLSACRFHDRSD